MAERLLVELPLKKAERRHLLAEKWDGRVFRFETDSQVGLEAFRGWSRPVRLRLAERDGEFYMEATDV